MSWRNKISIERQAIHKLQFQYTWDYILGTKSGRRFMVSLCLQDLHQTNKIYIRATHSVVYAIEKPKKKKPSPPLFNSSAFSLFVAIKGFRTVEFSSMISFNAFWPFFDSLFFVGLKTVRLGRIPKKKPECPWTYTHARTHLNIRSWVANNVDSLINILDQTKCFSICRIQKASIVLFHMKNVCHFSRKKLEKSGSHPKNKTV